MSRFSNYQDFDALGLADLVRARHVSPQELLQEARSRLSKVNPILNAVICPMDTLAESLAAKTDTQAPFCGVPFLVKDLMLPFAGFPLSNGSAAMKKYIPGANSDMAESDCPGRLGHIRKDQYIRIGRLVDYGSLRFRGNQEPLGSQPEFGRLQRRQRCCGCRQGRAYGPFHRWGRLDSTARLVLRNLRFQALSRTEPFRGYVEGLGRRRCQPCIHGKRS